MSWGHLKPHPGDHPRGQRHSNRESGGSHLQTETEGWVRKVMGRSVSEEQGTSLNKF